MKKASFMVAFLAIIQIVLGARNAQAQERLGQDRRTVEEALDLAGDDIGQELEELFAQLEITGAKIGEKLERWAEENSEELEAWSEKYGDDWERFGERFSKKMELMAQDQEGIWSQWAERYERDIERWADQLDSDELNAESIGGFVESNLDMLSKMPLGQLVDQALADGVGELKRAPWESLDELGQLARTALEEPVGELGALTLEGAKTKRALDGVSREMGRSLGRLKDDIGRNISDQSKDQADSASARAEARIRALKALLDRDGITEDQRNRVEEMIDATRAAQLDAAERRARSADSRQKDVDVSSRDQILERIEREKQRHAEALDLFNQDLRRSSEESRELDRRKADQRWQIEDARSPKRPDGRNLDSNSRRPLKAKEVQDFFRDGDGRQPRKQSPNTRRTQNRDSNRGGGDAHDRVKTEEAKSDTDMETLRRQIEELRKEVQRLKKDKGDW